MSLTTTAPSLSATHQAAVSKLVDLIYILERYEIVFARFGTIQKALSDSHFGMGSRFTALYSRILPYLPLVEGSEGTLLGTPDASAIADLNDLAAKYAEVCGDLISYLMDLGVEAQNELLGPLFDREVPPRNPADRTKRVLKRDDAAPRERLKGGWV